MNRLFAIVGILVTVALGGWTFQPGSWSPQANAADVRSPAASPASSPDKSKGEAIAAKKGLKSSASSEVAKERPVTYRIRQTVRLDEIQPGAKTVRMWVSIPDDEANQKVLDLNVVSAPGEWSIVPDAERRGRFVRIDVQEPQDAAIDVEVEFVVTRNPVYVAIDPNRVGPLSEGLQKALAAHLVVDAPHMEVSEKIMEIANEVCGDETNLATQATLLMDYVEKTADHYSYSKDPNMPTCGIGDAANCLAQGGGCCTDLHSLFIALARARGIPARLQMGYRLKEANVDKKVDPGYRCWVEYFIPNYGWISTDIVEADTPGGLGPSRWSTGLTARRVWLNQGREFQLADDLAVGRVNHMSIAYAEIDGVPARLLPEDKLKPQITRTVSFTELSP